LINSIGNAIQGNLLGTKIDGTSALGNGQFNIEFEAGCRNNSVGGTSPGAGNRIAYTGTYAGGPFAAVRVRDLATNNSVLGNAIFSNSALAISFSGLTATANDSCDADSGANLRQNFPVLTHAYSGANTGVRGYLNSSPNTTFRLQFFASPACDASGSGEAHLYLGDKIVTAGVACSNNFVATLPGAVPAGHVITVTATDPAGNTSEVSACRLVAPAPGLNIAAAESNQLSLSWTNTVTGFVLKETEDLAPPVQWSLVTNMPIVMNGQFVVTLSSEPGNRFYLLSFE
jgi:titin